MVTFTSGPAGERAEVDVDDYQQAETLVGCTLELIRERIIPGASDGTCVAIMTNAFARKLWRELPIDQTPRTLAAAVFRDMAEMIEQPAISALTPAMAELLTRSADNMNAFVVAMDDARLTDFFDGETKQ